MNNLGFVAGATHKKTAKATRNIDVDYRIAQNRITRKAGLCNSVIFDEEDSGQPNQVKINFYTALRQDLMRLSAKVNVYTPELVDWVLEDEFFN